MDPDPLPVGRPAAGLAAGLWRWWLPRLVVLVVLAAALGGVVGLVYYALRPDADEWRDLGALVLGLLAAAAVLAPGWLVVLVLLVRRFVPAGRRVVAWLAPVVVLGVVAVGLALLADAGRLPGGVAALVIAAVAVVGPPFVVRRPAGRAPLAPPAGDDEPAA